MKIMSCMLAKRRGGYRKVQGLCLEDALQRREVDDAKLPH